MKLIKGKLYIATTPFMIGEGKSCVIDTGDVVMCIRSAQWSGPIPSPLTLEHNGLLLHEKGLFHFRPFACLGQTPETLLKEAVAK